MRVALNGQSQTCADTSRQTATEVNVIYINIVISKGQLAKHLHFSFIYLNNVKWKVKVVLA